MRLSPLSDDGEVAELLIDKAMELMSEAEHAATKDEKLARTAGNRNGADGDEAH